MNNKSQIKIVEENFDNIFNSAADGILLAGAESKKLYIGNPAICRILGYTKEEIRKLSIADIHPEKDLPYVLEQFKMQAEGKIKVSKDLPVKRKDGTILYADINSTTVTINGVNYLVGFFHDNTERKKAEDTLRQSEEKYKSLIENLSVGIYRNTPGPKGYFLEANPAMISMFEAQSKDELMKHNVSDLYQNPEDRKDFVAEITKNGKVKNREVNLITLKGKKFAATVTAVAKKDEKGEVYFDGVIEDVSDRVENKELNDTKRALLNVMADLREVSIRNEAILVSIADGVIVVDKGGIIILMNNAAEKMLGWTVKESIGKKWFRILNGEDEKVAMKNAILGTTTTTTTTSAYYYIRKNGTKFPVARTVAPIVLGEKIIGAVSVFRDITREEEIDRMKTEFVSLASHQLRTPLTSIKWYLEMILERSTERMSEETRQYLTNINNSNETMIALVNSLLNISRIESGRLNIQPKPTDLAALFRDSVSKLSSQIKQAKLKIINKIPQGTPKLKVDPQLISNVYNNLLDNSIKYTPSGGYIEINIARKDGSLISQVRDSGRGIPAGEQSRVFERFFRASNVSGTSVGSTGLGLYLAKEIVEASGGKIWFESTEKRGSTFFFSLPLKGSPQKEGEVSLT